MAVSSSITNTGDLPLPRGCLEMLLPLLLSLLLLSLSLLLLLPPLALLQRQHCQGARLPWLAGLQHHVAQRILGLAAAWQHRRLEQSTLLAHQSQQQALRRCLRGGLGSQYPFPGNTGVFSRVYQCGPKRKKTHRTVRSQIPIFSLLPIQLSQRDPTQAWCYLGWQCPPGSQVVPHICSEFLLKGLTNCQVPL